jgi:hypothetical protein
LKPRRDGRDLPSAIHPGWRLARGTLCAVRKRLPLPPRRATWHLLATVLERTTRPQARPTHSEATAVRGRGACSDVLAGPGTPAEASRTKQMGSSISESGSSAYPGSAQRGQRADGGHPPIDRPTTHQARAHVEALGARSCEEDCPASHMAFGTVRVSGVGDGLRINGRFSAFLVRLADS